ncbi:uncharacterized protein LOC102712523 [Oryza brachyantha]|uniref:uncharacterized protein LOC102712523 n=1 Tax=Oryza brachyantha TaxID=4533 RepID=UPI00077684A8|nr:uncharacterized protein LOC102712523 [Oryza brachyantha]
MTIREFDELVLDGSNYPIWASDNKINFAFRGISKAIEDPIDGYPPVDDKKKMIAIFFLRLYIHKDLKHEYNLEIKALKERYDQQKELIWTEANFEWSQLRRQDFKTMAKKHHELSLKNAQQRPPGSTLLAEVHFNAKYNANNTKGFKGNSLNDPKSSTKKHKNNNRRKFKGRKKGNDKGKAPQARHNNNKHCNRCGSDYHVAKDCRIPNHLVLLYQKSLKEKKSSEELRYKAHFNLTNEARPEVGSSQKAPIEPENNLDLPPEDIGPLSSTDDMLIEFCSMDPLGDLQ